MLFRSLPAAGFSEGMPWYAGFRGVDLANPTVALPENWTGSGQTALPNLARLCPQGPKDADLYWAIAPLRPGETRRSSGGAVAQTVLIARRCD